MIGYGTRKIIFKLPPFWIMNEELQERENSKSNENKNIFVFIWCIGFSRSWFSSFNLQKGGFFKIIFPLPHPIIYNPGRYNVVHHVHVIVAADTNFFLYHWNGWENKNVLNLLDFFSFDVVVIIVVIWDEYLYSTYTLQK